MARYIDADKLVDWCKETFQVQSTVAGKAYVDAFLTAVCSCPTADVAPRAEVASEIFEEIERIFDQHTEGGYYLNGVWFHKRLDLDTREAIAELKKKYQEGEE